MHMLVKVILIVPPAGVSRISQVGSGRIGSARDGSGVVPRRVRVANAPPSGRRSCHTQPGFRRCSLGSMRVGFLTLVYAGWVATPYILPPPPVHTTSPPVAAKAPPSGSAQVTSMPPVT